MYDVNKVRALNDELRTKFTGGKLMATPGILALNDLPAILQKLKDFSDFNPGNDTHMEHDMGSFQHRGQLLFWKIDYYDPDLMMGSSDPSEPAVTARILTLMLAEEY